jgi:hypothetical protein
MTRASRILHCHDPPLRLPAAHEISLLLFDLASGCTQEGERRLRFRRRRDAAGEGERGASATGLLGVRGHHSNANWTGRPLPVNFPIQWSTLAPRRAVLPGPPRRPAA